MHTRIAVACLLSLCILTPLAGASTHTDLDQAAKQQQVAFILVSEPASTGLEAARDLIRQTMAKVEKSTLIELNRSDPANADLVAKFRLAGAPVPLILVAARNGALAGGVPVVQATTERLVALVPSPKRAEILLALQSGKSVFICVGRKSMSSQPKTIATCESACGQSSGKCVLIQVDMDDPAETAFLTALKVDLTATEPVTLVVNTAGQIAGTYTGAVDAGELVATTTKKVGGCCPATAAGGSKSCSPQKQ